MEDGREIWRYQKDNRDRLIVDLEAEIEKLKKDVIHWREARRMAIDGGDMLKTELDAARAEIERLKKEAIHWKKAFTSAQSEELAAVAEADELRAKIERLKAALHPFAVSADAYEPRENDDNEPAFSECFTLGDLRRAKDALN